MTHKWFLRRCKRDLISAYSMKPLYNFLGDIARIEFGPVGDIIDKFVLKKERFEKPYSLE